MPRTSSLITHRSALITSLALLFAPAVVRADPLEAESLAGAAKVRGAKAVPDDRLEESARVAVTMDIGSDAALLALCKLPAVGAIVIGDAGRCTDAGYAALKELPNLQKLSLGKSGATDKTVAVIGTLRTVQELFLGDARVTDAGMAGLKGMKHLRDLDLIDARITDRGLAPLAGLAKLERLNLSGTKVTDAGLKQLEGLTKLKLLRLNRTNATRQAMTDLEKAIPGLTVRD